MLDSPLVIVTNLNLTRPIVLNNVNEKSNFIITCISII